MKKIFPIITLLLMTACMFSCKREDPLLKAARESALKQSVFGVFDGEKAIFSYDEDNHQFAHNKVQRMFRIQNDSQSKLLQMTLDKEPTQGATCKLTLKTRGLPSVGSNCTVEVLKVSEEDNMVWLLDHESLTSYVMYYDFN